MNLLQGYSDEQIEKAKQLNNLLKESSKLEVQMKTLTQALQQTMLAKSPDSILPKESDFPLSTLLGHKTLPPHPVYVEFYRLAQLTQDEKTEDELREEVLEAMSVKTILLAYEAREIMEKIKELDAELS